MYNWTLKHLRKLQFNTLTITATKLIEYVLIKVIKHLHSGNQIKSSSSS